jgi:Mrp family chromosome partitioning ATPase
VPAPIVTLSRQIETDPSSCACGHACSFCPEEDSCQRDKPGHDRDLVAERLAAMDRILLVLGNKGGVGKSTVAANLAAALAQKGHRVGLADADIHGPNAGVFFGCQGERVRVGSGGIRPSRYRSPDSNTGLALGSLAMLLPELDSPVVWRDAYKFEFIHHLAGSFDWGPLDYWVVDMPPGTGNELITLCDLLEGCQAAALLVTTPQAIALHDSLKAARFCRERGLPILGWVENMAGVVCPHCGGEIQLFPTSELSERLTAAGLATLARLPLSPRLAFGSDAGAPVVVADPGSPEAESFTDLASRCMDWPAPS